MIDPAEWEGTLANARRTLLAERGPEGHWTGELSTSALSTATALVALGSVDAGAHAGRIDAACAWLMGHQNADGGWGDTTRSFSNISTTLLCWSALVRHGGPDAAEASRRASWWIRDYVGSLEPDRIAETVKARYGKDRTFSVPILMLCAICGTLGPRGWGQVMQMPHWLAGFPRGWFAALRLPVVSYALPALIAIGYAKSRQGLAGAGLGGLRDPLWPRLSGLLESIQPASGGFLEAAPLTSFVTMALVAAGEREHPVARRGVAFLLDTVRPDGSWPIDTNLATWATTLAVKALCAGSGLAAETGKGRQPARADSPGATKEGLVDGTTLFDGSEQGSVGGTTLFDGSEQGSVGGTTLFDGHAEVRRWLLGQQYRERHPFTDAAPGGWAWTDLSGGVPDADDTPGALLALRALAPGGDDAEAREAAEAGVAWLLGLQNRDGGLPTFCRGWGALPFDRSSPDLTAHALRAWRAWHAEMPQALQRRMAGAGRRALGYLLREQRTDGSWRPLWFGNQHRADDEENPTYGTAKVLLALAEMAGGEAAAAAERGRDWLLRNQNPDGGWGAARGTTPSTVEETALALSALACLSAHRTASVVERPNAEVRAAFPGGLDAAIGGGVAWLRRATEEGTRFEASPIGFYFAKLWYFEKAYPIVWTVEALERLRLTAGSGEGGWS